MNKVALGDRISLEYGFGIRAKGEPSGEYPLITSGGIRAYIGTHKIDGPGVIIGRKGSVGSLYFTELNFTPSDTTYYLRLLDPSKDNLKFWFYFLAALKLEKRNTHTGVPGLNRELAYLMKVDIPSKEVQQKISELLSSIDKKIELNNKINATLEEMAKTIYGYWFVQFDFPDENGNPYKSSGGKMVYNEELKREIPEGWWEGGLSSIGSIVGGSTPSTSNQENFDKDGTPWITPKDMSRNVGCKYISSGDIGVTSQGIKSASLKVYPSGTVLMSSRAPVGYLAIARNPVTTNQGFKSFIPDKSYSSNFNYYTLQLVLKGIISYSSGSTFKEISSEVLKTVPIVLPPNQLEFKWADKLNALFNSQDLLEQENNKLVELRDCLLPMLMNGQVSVS